MRHKWDRLSYGKEDKCEVCGLMRRVIAKFHENLQLIPYPLRQYLVNGEWLDPAQTDLGKSCPGHPTEETTKPLNPHI